MMHGIHKWTTSLAIGMLLATGCAMDGDIDDAGECSLPGDIDCSADTATGDGKGDGWDWRNDPTRLAQNLNYRVSEQPKKGRVDGEVWAASYWPTYKGSTNDRWQGADVLSPVEKYDQALNGWTPDAEYATSVPRDCGPDAKVEFNKYRNTLGPAAKWQTTVQGRSQMFDGVDSDDDGEIDECGGSDYDGIGTWWGYCPGWVAAAILNRGEPLHAVEKNGVRFETSDIKALLMGQYEGANAMMLGGRCNAKDIDHSENGRVMPTECRDTNAGAWHVIITNFVGINKKPFAEDRTGGFEVWNQPVVGYDMTTFKEITLAKANDLLDETGDTYAFNDKAVKFYEVRMSVEYITEAYASTRPVGMDDYIRTDRYHYIVEVNGDDKVIGGEWLGSSRDNHPDFLWVPTGVSRYSSSVNPSVDLDEILSLLEASRTPTSNSDGGVWTGNASLISYTTGDGTGYGLNYDIGRIHPDLGAKQTTFFQWEIDGKDGRRFKISADGVARAKITYGSWSNRDNDRTYDVALPFVLDPTKDGNKADDGTYYTIAVEFDEAPAAATDVRGAATSDAASDATSRPGAAITVDGMTWNGNASIISLTGNCTSTTNCFGVEYDIANIHPSSDKLPVVFFQWEIDQQNGKTLEIKADGMDKATITYGSWSGRKDDVTRTVTLPYTLNPADDGKSVADGQYYTIKVAFPKNPSAKTSVWATAK